MKNNRSQVQVSITTYVCRGRPLRLPFNRSLSMHNIAEKERAKTNPEY